MKRFFLSTAAGALALCAAVAPASAHGWQQFGWGWPPVYIAPVPYQPAPYLYAPFAYQAYQGHAYMAVPGSPPDPTINYMQDGLNRLGYGPLVVDGVEGPATVDALRRFQANNGLAADGFPGTATLAVLNGQLGLKPLPYVPPPPPAPVAAAPVAHPPTLDPPPDPALSMQQSREQVIRAGEAHCRRFADPVVCHEKK